MNKLHSRTTSEKSNLQVFIRRRIVRKIYCNIDVYARSHDHPSYMLQKPDANNCIRYHIGVAIVTRLLGAFGQTANYNH